MRANETKKGMWVVLRGELRATIIDDLKGSARMIETTEPLGLPLCMHLRLPAARASVS